MGISVGWDRKKQSPVLRSAKRVPANVRQLNNRKWRQSYCLVGERSRALALLNAALYHGSCGTIKIPPRLKTKSARKDLSTSIMTSPYEWNTLENDVIQHKSINQLITIHVIYDIILQIKIFAMINVFNPLITLKPIYNVLSSKIKSILTSLCMLCFAEITMKCSYMHIWVDIKMICTL